MHSAYQGKIIKCDNCGCKYHHPLCDIYEYEGVNRFYTGFPKTEVGFCLDCNKFVCIQKGIKNNDVNRLRGSAKPNVKTHYDVLLNMMQGKDSVDSCSICGSLNVTSLENSICPSCGNKKFSIIDEYKPDGIMFHYSRKYISPKLLEKQPKEVKIRESFGNSNVDNKHIKANGHNALLDFIRWIGVLPVSILAWIVVFWIINLAYKIFIPVEMTQWAITFMSSGGSGMAFVLVGSWLAPKGKNIVSIVLATIMCVFSLVSLTFALYGYGENSMAISILSGASTIIGCVFGSIQMHSEK